MLDTIRLTDRIEATYRERTPGSSTLFERAQHVLPMGTSGSAMFYRPYPVYLAGAEGGLVWDVDGNQYVDYLMGAGPNILGHRHPAVHAAVAAQMEQITQTLTPTRLQVELAERIQGHMPYIERLRFTNTGSEAVRSCLRAARAFTGRTGVAKVEGGFHGTDDPFVISTSSVAGPADAPVPALESSGVPGYIADDVLVLPFNDAEGAARLIAERADSLAAVFMEPVAFSTGGALPIEPAFARRIREVTKRFGILLVFDEVVTCYRMGLGGAPSYLGVTPDLSALGKALGGGFPLAAMGGSAQVMETVLGEESFHNRKRIFQSGTFTGNAVSVAAGHAVLTVLEQEPVLETIDALGERLRRGLQQLFDAYGVHGQVTGDRSIFQLHFTERPPRSRRDIVAGDLEGLRLFLLGMVAEGVLWPPIHPGVTAYSHTPEQIDRSLAAAERLLPLFAAR
jgi:glutamate-1-semialdehyde 2,1-aminomutase